MPLVIDNFVVFNRTSNAASTTAMASEVASAPANSQNSSSSSKGSYIDVLQAVIPPHLRSNGTIAGMAIGGCMALIGLTIFIFFIRRRQGRLGNSWYGGTYRHPLNEDGMD